MLATPPDWSPAMAETANALADSRRWKIAADGHDADAVAELVASGWMARWDADPTGVSVTFTAIGAKGLGLILDDEPARWMTPDEGRSLRAKRGKAKAREVNATDLDIDLDKRVGWSPPDDGGMARSVFVIGLGGVWAGPDTGNLAGRPDRACQMCGDRPAPKGCLCGKCDGLKLSAKTRGRRRAGCSAAADGTVTASASARSVARKAINSAVAPGKPNITATCSGGWNQPARDVGQADSGTGGEGEAVIVMSRAPGSACGGSYDDCAESRVPDDGPGPIPASGLTARPSRNRASCRACGLLRSSKADALG